MSILTPTKPKLPSSRELVGQIELHGAVVSETEAECAAIAMSAPLSDEHKRAAAKLADAEKHWKLLNQALDAAKRREADQLEEDRAAIALTQRRACLAHLSTLEKETATFADQLAVTVGAYQRLIALRRKATAATPIGTEIPNDGCFEVGDIAEAVLREMARVGAEGVDVKPQPDDQMRFPGTRPTDASELALLRPLMDACKAGLKNFRDALNKKAP